MSAAALLHAATYGTRLGDSAQARMRELERELAALKGEDAPAGDPRVVAAIGKYARLLAEQRLSSRAAGAMRRVPLEGRPS